MVMSVGIMIVNGTTDETEMGEETPDPSDADDDSDDEGRRRLHRDDRQYDAHDSGIRA